MDSGASADRRTNAGTADPVRLRFKIQAFTPATMPMARLASYLEHLAIILGEAQSVHLVDIEGGSTTAVLHIEPEAFPRVNGRIDSLQQGLGSDSARQAVRSIEKFLREDRAEHGYLIDARGDTLAAFDGTNGSHEREYGPFSQFGTIEGIPIAIGGKNDPVPVRLEAPDETHYCTSARPLAKRISEHLFTNSLRVSGLGRWSRDRDGRWIMHSFRIEDFEVLREESLLAVTERLQAIDADWKRLDDPLGALAEIRGLDD